MSGLRVNHNLANLRSQRVLGTNSTRMAKTMEHLSAGKQLVRSADSPAAVSISSHLKTQAAGLKQAVMNSETAVSLVQTTEISLQEVNSVLLNMKQLAIHAANEAINDPVMLEADRKEFIDSLNSIDRIANETRFGDKTLLNGNQGTNGVVSGRGLTFYSASEKTEESPAGGYPVEISQFPTKAKIVSKIPLTRDIIDDVEKIAINDGSRSTSYTTQPGETPKEVEAKLQNLIKKNKVQVDLRLNERNQIIIEHKKIGKRFSFEAASTTPGLLSEESYEFQTVNNGKDINGHIGGFPVYGDGSVMTALEGSPIEGLNISYVGESIGNVGTVQIKQNSFQFQVGGNRNQITSIKVPSTHTVSLANNVPNESGFHNLREIDIGSYQGASDALNLIDKAIYEVSSTRSKLGAFQKNTLATNLTSLHIARNEMTKAHSAIEDADMALELSNLTKRKMLFESSKKVVKNTTQSTDSISKLLDNQ